MLEDFPDTRPGGANDGGTNVLATLGYTGTLSLQSGAFTNQGPIYNGSDFDSRRMDTNPLLTLSADQLRRAATIKEQIEALNAELSAILGGQASGPAATTSGPKLGRPPGKGGMSAAGRANIAAGVKARWAKINAAKGGAAPTNPPTVEAPAKKKRTMSPAARKKIAAAMKARWAKVKAENANS